LQNRTKGGELITVDSSVSPIHGSGGSIIGFIAVQNDITEQKRADRERKRLEMELFQAQKIESLGTLAGGIAHDFNNILGIILGHATLLEQGNGSPVKFEKSRDSIIAAARRGASLVQQILTFARKSDISFETVDVNETITDLVRMMEETFPETISFSLRLSPEAPAIEADRTRLHQTLLNLCVNARDAMPEGGTIAISTERVMGRLPGTIADTGTHEYLCARISDTGVGMDAPTRRRIFEPFFTTKPEGKGTGLGLAVVDGIMRSHGGHIEVESEPHRGTTFLLYFPVSLNGQPSSGSHQALFGSVRGGSETILLVEDEEALLDMVRGLLELKGYTVLAASDGEEAVRLYTERAKEIALVISDMGLPKLDGGNVYLQIRAINPTAKVLLVSGYVEPETKAALLGKGVRAFLQKPYVPQEILRQVREVIDTA
jgi:signal transduction histidine kinase/CheY-like chemotaxis protein